MKFASVAVVGAGLAGIACARTLAAAGVHCRVFESQRSPGGRLATRRFAVASFDHGAQYLTATDPHFGAVLAEARAARAADIWRPDWRRESARELWVGIPGMNGLPRFLSRNLDVEYGARVTRLERSRRGWALIDDRGAAHADFSGVALALPAPAAAALAGVRTPLAARARSVSMAPCWATLVAFERPLESVPDAGFPGDSMLAWFARNASKPGRDAGDAWVLHASAGWSRTAFDRPAEIVVRALLDRFSEHVGRALPRVLLSDAHRWRYARVEAPLGESFLLDADAGVGFCGDWCLDARAEAAWLSGMALGTAFARARPEARSGRLRGSR
jgi:predicted NAD/FAD-dependent oxidoreductase